MELLMRLLDDGMSTRLYHRICDQQGLCYDVSGHYETYADSGLVELEAESAHPRAPLVLEQLLGIVRELRDQVPPDQEVEIAKRRHRWRLEQLPDEPGEVAEFFALEELSGSRQSPYERQALIETLTPADIQLAAQTWFTAQNLSVVAVGAPKKAAVRRMEQLVSEFGKD
jgi:predicted Zn-dependent peptidase